MKFIPSSEAQLRAAIEGSVKCSWWKVYCKLFTTNILSTRLAAPRSPRMSLYPVGLVRHLFFTCDECVYVGFSLTKQQAFFWKVSSNSCLIGCDQLYTGHASGSSREKGLIKLTVTWRSGNNEVVSSTPQQWPTLLYSESAPNITHQINHLLKSQTPPRGIRHIYITQEHKTTSFFFFSWQCYAVVWNSTSTKFAKIWRIKGDGLSVIKFEVVRIHCFSDVFVTVSVVVT